MKDPILQKPVLSPFLVTIFAAISVTGVLLFFHIKNGSIVVVHEWLGLIFVVTGLIHLILNFRQFSAYLKLRRSWIAITAAALLILVLALAGLNHKGGHNRGQPPAMQVGK